MSSEKSERLMNLLIMLLVQRHYATKERIRENVYPGSGREAFEKMFERDKEELRSLGVPVEVGRMDAYFDDEPGYRIRPDEFALPPIELDAQEAAVVGLATKVWEHATLAEATTEAVRKLTAAGVDIDRAPLDIAEPRLDAGEPAFDAVWQATCDRTPIEFDYLRTGEGAPTTRRLEPWGVTRYSGRWYVVGLDTDRGAQRVFRLSRVRGEVRTVGPAGSYSVPPGVDMREVTRQLAPDHREVRVVVLVREGAAWPLRRVAEDVDTGVRGPDDDTRWDRLTLTLVGSDPADQVLGFGADVCVEEPAELRDDVVRRLRGALR